MLNFPHFSVSPEKDTRLSLLINRESSARISGFTLIELLVVISLFSLMIAFSFPRLSGMFSDTDRDAIARWLIAQTTIARTKAVKEQKPYILRIDIGANTFSVSAAEPSLLREEAINDGELPEIEMLDSVNTDSEALAEPQLTLSDNVSILDVVFAGERPITMGRIDIRFYEQGYSDRAIIHIEEDGSRISFYLAPFLSQIGVYDDYIRFGQRGDLL